MTYRSPLPLSDEHMRLTGIVAAHWEWLERVILERAIAEIMELDYDRVAILLTNIGFSSKCDILSIYIDTVKPFDADKHTRLKKAVADIREAYAERNKFVHAVWIPGADTPTRSEFRTRSGKLKVGDHPTASDEIANAAETIIQAGDRFVSLLQEFGLLQPLPRKPKLPIA